MKNAFQGVIFDFDCTLADSKQGMYQCIKTVLEKMNQPLPSYDDAIKTIGLPPEEKFTFLTKINNEAERSKFKSLYLELINPPSSYLLSYTMLFSGVIELLALIKNSDCKIAIFSTKTRLALEEELIHLKIMPYIDFIQAGDDVLYPKPNPEGILNVLSEWKMPKNDILYIGDHVLDAKAAMAAGVHFMGVTTGTCSEAALSEYPHLLITSAINNIATEF